MTRKTWRWKNRLKLFKRNKRVEYEEQQHPFILFLGNLPLFTLYSRLLKAITFHRMCPFERSLNERAVSTYLTVNETTFVLFHLSVPLCVFSTPDPDYRDPLVIKQHKGIQPERYVTVLEPPLLAWQNTRQLAATRREANACNKAFKIDYLGSIVRSDRRRNVVKYWPKWPKSDNLGQLIVLSTLA